MKHFNVMQWTDYVRGVSSEQDRAAMQGHLDTGCAKCAGVVGLLQKFVSVISAETNPEVPDYLIHNAKAIFALRQPEKVTLSRLVANLVYDSFREPLPAGVRSQQRMSRQAMYEAGEFCVDLRLEHERGGSTVTLVGQVANRREPARAVAGTPISLLSGKQIVAHTNSNEFGEFQLQYEPKPHLRLHLPVADTGKWIEVRLAELESDKSTKPHKTTDQDLDAGKSR